MKNETLKKIKIKIYKTLHLCGPRVLKWLAIGVFAAFCQGYFEFLAIAFLQLVLKRYGAIAESVNMPFMEFFDSLTPMATIGLLIGVIAFNFCLRYLVISSGALSSVLIRVRMRMAAYYEILQLKKPKYVPASVLHYRITEVAQRTACFCKLVVDILNGCVQALVYLGIMLLLSWKLTFISVSLLGLLGFGLLWISKSIQPYAKQMPDAIMSINQSVQRVARNWLLVNILKTNNKEYENLINKELKYQHGTLKIIFLTFFATELPRTMGAILIVGIIVVNVAFIQVNEAELLTFVFMFMRLSQMLAIISQSSGTMIAQYPFYKEAIDDYDIDSDSEVPSSYEPIRKIGMNRPRYYFKNHRILSYKNLPEIKEAPSIELKNITFAYNDHTPPIVSDLGISFPKGSQTGIIGRSGSGKTTILGLLLGLLEPQKGEVLINGELSSTFLSNNRLCVGYVGPEAFLIEGSLLDNLYYGCIHEKPSLDQVDEALKMAQLYDFVQTLPEGLNYKINENGEGLSAGQKQRVALARCLLVNPNLIILDEVSANLDNETEFEISEVLKDLRGECTTVIVSHKPGILKYAENIYNLDSADKSKTGELAQVS